MASLNACVFIKLITQRIFLGIVIKKTQLHLNAWSCPAVGYYICGFNLQKLICFPTVLIFCIFFFLLFFLSFFFFKFGADMKEWRAFYCQKRVTYFIRYSCTSTRTWLFPCAITSFHRRIIPICWRTNWEDLRRLKATLALYRVDADASKV